jgi:hypothetical protein
MKVKSMSFLAYCMDATYYIMLLMCMPFVARNCAGTILSSLRSVMAKAHFTII